MKSAHLVCIVALVGLSGCDVDNGFQDLQTYMDEVRARPRGAIEPLPAFRPYEAFTYGAAAMRSPFQAPVKIDPASQRRGSRDIRPDESRSRQYLERFNIEVFEMVGTLSNGTGMQALVRGAGGVHRVRVGDYLGRNHGRVVEIDGASVEVVEIVPDGDGGWLERPRSLALKERS
ncbi:Pilus assembly protein [Azotobacter vinelandii CA]|uniref:Pilus assembly protein n=2 Tax=Azotobacter vinelandii TaxID=354 RepID=C1DHQ8_AZOVD|nr:pilus assembly protein PilP [Azotobacter vinelandii]ACO80641.1 Pilus assembly protein [Azotobacter vinelandii DJ]AGK13866.1 Pilus assembly protein [Azotobacter vinelandii CA]AGK18523.1 Pilus assembly protein [Azotobacter vinelandii CA6]WKN21395.1 pilus assembly protein PilP [Azotobacter vinelandii]SFX79511.1 type IV pilus assembly protein PilP [Azotobacter vinelandii]